MSAGWIVFWVAFSFFMGAFVAVLIPLERARSRGPWADDDGYLSRLAPTPKDRIDQLIEDDAATRERRP